MGKLPGKAQAGSSRHTTLSAQSNVRLPKAQLLLATERPAAQNEHPR